MRRVTDNALSGSCLTHLQSLRNAVRVFGRSIREASVLCSRNAGRLLRLKKGYLAAGMDADIILLNANLELVATFVSGELLHGSL
jgi:N-acetylglucosamine-6-phosphate deacetylase